MMLKVGHIREAHGLKGDVVVVIHTGEVNDLPWLKKGSLLELRSGTPTVRHLKILSARPQRDFLVVGFEGVADRTEAESLKGFEIWVDEKFFVSRKGQNIFLREVLGFQVFNRGDLIGRVKGFSSNGPQDLLIVGLVSEGKEALVPLVHDFIEKMDYEKKRILMNLPEGLLDEQE